MDGCLLISIEAVCLIVDSSSSRQLPRPRIGLSRDGELGISRGIGNELVASTGRNIIAALTNGTVVQS